MLSFALKCESIAVLNIVAMSETYVVRFGGAQVQGRKTVTGSN